MSIYPASEPVARPGTEKPCTKCGARVGESCRTLASGRVTDTHKARWPEELKRQGRKVT